ncbi:MAG: DUF4256 domain-containing protein, partial [Bacteroidota bacterium]
MSDKRLGATDSRNLIKLLEQRFVENMNRHFGVSWEDVLTSLSNHPVKLWTLHEMEKTGGEPDVIQHDIKTGRFLFADCCTESPLGRRSLCYDRVGLESRKEHKPSHAACEMAGEMGVELMNESQYRQLQQLGAFDLKTSSWLKTPEEIRKLGGAIFGDRRYDTVFVYHNGAQSYYAARGFRC